MGSIGRYASKLSKATKLLSRPVWRQALLKGVAATIEHRDLARFVTPRTVIDIGANKGQFTLFALQTWPGCRVFAFEPLQGPARTFRNVTGGHPNVSLYETAVGPSSGPAEMHLSQREDSSSLLPISAEMERAYPEARASGSTQTVKVTRLDAVLPQAELEGPTLVKLDVQGFELEALRSFGELLGAIDHIYVECSYIELYSGQPLIADIEQFLSSSGYVRQAELNRTRDSLSQNLQSDCLFTRTERMAA